MIYTITYTSHSGKLCTPTFSDINMMNIFLQAVQNMGIKPRVTAKKAPKKEPMLSLEDLQGMSFKQVKKGLK